MVVLPALIHNKMKDKTNYHSRMPITDCNLAEAYVHKDLCGIDHEEAWVAFLTLANTVICKEMVAKGTLNAASIDCRTVLRRALLNNAGNIILAHNHPSGNPRPSTKDIEFTNRLRDACKLMGIELLDHIIIADGSFYSFAEDRIINLEQSELLSSDRQTI